MNYFLTSLRKENYFVLEQNQFKLIGFSAKSKLADTLCEGDYIFIYIGSRMSKIAGVVKVLSTVHWDTSLVWDDIFPKRIKIEPIIMLRKDNMIDVRDILNNLGFVPNKERYGMSFAAGLRKVPSVDGKFIMSELTKRSRLNEV